MGGAQGLNSTGEAPAKVTRRGQHKHSPAWSGVGSSSYPLIMACRIWGSKHLDVTYLLW